MVTIKEIISRESKTNFPESFRINNVLTNDKTLIANEFNTYFANAGSNLASQMTNNRNTAYHDFLPNASLNNILLHKLNYYGIKNSALDLFKMYLSNRKHYVDFLNNRSAYARLRVGVHQGSILGPLLFIIYVNDITASSNIFKSYYVC